MSIGRRIVDLARSNLTDFREAFSRDALRERLSPPVPDEEASDDPESVGARAGRHARDLRDAAEVAWDRAYAAAKERGIDPETIGSGALGRAGEPERLRWYRTLELEPGANLDEVRRAYRRLVKQYHPDRFARDPEKLRVATEVSRKLTEAYNGLTAHLTR